MTLQAAYTRARWDTGARRYDPIPLPPVPAVSAYRIAQWRETAPDWHGLESTGADPDDREPMARGIVDGFTVEIRAEPDLDGPDWGGEFRPARDRYGERIPKPDPSAVLWTNGGCWSLEPGATYWYIPEEPIADVITYWSGRGASRQVAREYAAAMMKARADGDAEERDNVYLVRAVVSRGGIELGSSVIGGVSLGGSFEERERYVAEVAADLIPEAMEEARGNLENLSTSDEEEES